MTLLLKMNEYHAIAETVLASGKIPDQYRITKRMYDDENSRYIMAINKKAAQNLMVMTMMRGAESGLSPMQSLYGIRYYNNRPCIGYDMALALVQAHNDYQGHAAVYREDMLECTVEITRNNFATIKSFSMQEAERAGLTKLDHWKKYPERMLMIRAATWALRDSFSDVLNGLSITEEQQDVELVAAQPTDKPEPVIDQFTAEALAEKDPNDKPDFSTIARTKKKHKADGNTTRLTFA